jgi:hypothetical protein
MLLSQFGFTHCPQKQVMEEQFLHHLLNSTLIHVNSADHLRILLDTLDAVVFGVDVGERPAKLNPDYTFYSVPSHLFATLNIPVKTGLYVYRSIDRKLIPVTKNEFEKHMTTQLIDLSKPITSKYDFFGGFVLRKNMTQNEVKVEMNVLTTIAVKRPKKFGFGILPRSLIEESGLQFLSGRLFVVFRNSLNESKRLRYLLRGEEAHDVDSVLTFLDQIARGRLNYTIVSEDDQQEFFINRHNFSGAVGRGIDTLILFADEKASSLLQFYTAKRIQQLLHIQFFVFNVTTNDLPGNLVLESVPTFVLFSPQRTPKGLGLPHTFKELFNAVVDFSSAHFTIPQFTSKTIDDQIQQDYKSHFN